MLGHKPAGIIDETQSLCPYCLKVLPATVVECEGRVYMHKVCRDHGEFQVYLWPDADHYRWFSGFNFAAAPRAPQMESVNECPRDCGLCPHHRRHITLAEIEVTRRCNLSCPVCFMSAGLTPADPTLEAITGIFKTIRRFDGEDTAIQLTGGEPTLRADLPDIIRQGRQLGFTAIEVNTNGLVIAHDLDYVRALKEAGLEGIYLQFDGVEPETTHTLRGADLLSDKLKAIENCRSVGLQVILAATIIQGINESQLGALLAFALNNLDVVGGLALQPAFASGRFNVPMEKHLSIGDIVELLTEQTGCRLAVNDFWPLGCSHPLCSCATYLLGDADNYEPFTRHIDENDYYSCFDTKSPQGSVLPDILARIYPDKSFFKGLSVVIMGYMDAWTIDLNRLKECSMAVATHDGRTVPFCAYNLTNVAGQHLYTPVGGRTFPVESPEIKL
jgi:uncharacterized radical SAM superfamily Fe-S cluster-containing enzyme